MVLHLLRGDSCSAIDCSDVVELPVTIGRGKQVQIRLADRWVSRRHCRLEVADGKLRIRDLGSRNGTLLNRQPVTEATLEPGDQLHIGMTVLTISDELFDERGDYENPEISIRIEAV